MSRGASGRGAPGGLPACPPGRGGALSLERPAPVLLDNEPELEDQHFAADLPGGNEVLGCLTSRLAAESGPAGGVRDGHGACRNQIGRGGRGGRACSLL